MVLSSTMIAVTGAMAPAPGELGEAKSVGDITAASKLDRKTVEKALSDLMALGVVTKTNVLKRSGKRNGWIRVVYRLSTVRPESK
jgi:predicted transcriptional regulator